MKKTLNRIAGSGEPAMTQGHYRASCGSHGVLQETANEKITAAAASQHSTWCEYPVTLEFFRLITVFSNGKEAKRAAFRSSGL